MEITKAVSVWAGDVSTLGEVIDNGGWEGDADMAYDLMDKIEDALEGKEMGSSVTIELSDDEKAVIESAMEFLTEDGDESGVD